MADHSYDYDVIFIGAGPGGYVGAIRAAQLGLKTACVESRETLGGTCLNVGCIPSKAMLHATELFREAGHGFAEMGIKVGTPTLDLPAMMKHKQETVDANVNGVAFLLRKNKVESHHGLGTIVAPGQVKVTADDGSSKVLEAKNIVIVNTGVSTEGPVTVVVRETLEHKNVRIPVAHIRALGNATRGMMSQKLGGHADEMEASLILAIAPELAHIDRAVEDYGNALNEPKTVFYIPTIFRGNAKSTPDYSVSGARGDPRGVRDGHAVGARGRNRERPRPPLLDPHQFAAGGRRGPRHARVRRVPRHRRPEARRTAAEAAERLAPDVVRRRGAVRVALVPGRRRGGDRSQGQLGE